MLWGETFLVSALSNHLRAGNWAAPEGGFFWEALTRKIPATSAGTKLQNKEKPAVCKLLTAGLALLNENEPLSKKRSKESRFYAAFQHFPVRLMLTEQK